jgi:murein DD-endopeptidase MepM/ murein hydrolase activator NlpD
VRSLSVEIGPGDTLWRIARQHDSTPAEIAEANGIAVDAVLHPGDRLVVPGAYVQAQNGPDQGGFAAPTISVDPGDTLWEISRRYGTTVEALMRANDLTDATLRPGQELNIVGGDGAPVAAAAAGVQATPSQAAVEAAQEAAMVWPLNGPLTSNFGWRALRIGGSNMHYGLDIDGQTGEPIVAAAAGTVTYADWMGGFGKVVIVQQGGTEYLYAHASELLARVGQQVEPGTLIARVGTTGRVTGSHLHFEIRVDGNAVDPAPILAARAGAR